MGTDATVATPAANTGRLTSEQGERGLRPASDTAATTTGRLAGFCGDVDAHPTIFRTCSVDDRAMMSTDLAIFVFVVGLRFGVPLLILRFPLPAIVAGYIIVLRVSEDPIDEGALVFFVLLLTLVITIYDRYRPIRAARYHAPIDPPRDR